MFFHYLKRRRKFQSFLTWVHGNFKKCNHKENRKVSVNINRLEENGMRKIWEPRNRQNKSIMIDIFISFCLDWLGWDTWSFLGDINSLFLDCGNCYIGLCTYQYSGLNTN